MPLETGEILLAEIPAEGREVLRLTLQQYQGRPVVDARLCYVNNAGERRRTKRGFTVGRELSAQIASGFAAAAGKP